MVYAFSNKLVFTFDLLPDVALGALNPQHFLLNVKPTFKLQTATRGFRCCGEHSHNYSSAGCARGSRDRERGRDRDTSALPRERQLIFLSHVRLRQVTITKVTMH